MRDGLQSKPGAGSSFQSVVNRLKWSLRHRRFARLGLTEESLLSKQELGSGSGSWTVHTERLGPCSTVYSFGVGTDVSFDVALIEQRGATVHAFDPTPRSIEWVGRQRLPEGLMFHDFGVASHDGNATFFPSRRVASAHYAPIRRYRGPADETVEGRVYRLRTIASMLGHDVIDLLKMDIEGGEYDVIDDVIAFRPVISQIAIEFHHAYETIPFERTVEALEKLRRAGYRILHITDRTYEITLVHESFEP